MDGSSFKQAPEICYVLIEKGWNEHDSLAWLITESLAGRCNIQSLNGNPTWACQSMTKFLSENSVTLRSKGDFHTNTLMTREVSGLVLREMIHGPGISIPKHSHERAHVAFILRGVCAERCEMKTLECKPLSVSFLAPGITHSDHFGNGVHCFLVEIEPQRLDSGRRDFGTRKARRVPQIPRSLELAVADAVIIFQIEISNLKSKLVMTYSKKLKHR